MLSHTHLQQRKVYIKNHQKMWKLIKLCPLLYLIVIPCSGGKCMKQLKCPLLAVLAKKILCIPATSVASERFFSTAGDIVTSQRACLKPSHVDKLIFLKKKSTVTQIIAMLIVLPAHSDVTYSDILIFFEKIRQLNIH